MTGCYRGVLTNDKSYRDVLTNDRVLQRCIDRWQVLQRCIDQWQGATEVYVQRGRKTERHLRCSLKINLRSGLPGLGHPDVPCKHADIRNTGRKAGHTEGQLCSPFRLAITERMSQRRLDKILEYFLTRILQVSLKHLQQADLSHISGDTSLLISLKQ
jgi:hypothetical protein